MRKGPDFDYDKWNISVVLQHKQLAIIIKALVSNSTNINKTSHLKALMKIQIQACGMHNKLVYLRIGQFIR
jgi:hypothetical protein